MPNLGSGNMLVDRNETENDMPEVQVCLDCGAKYCVCDDMYELGKDD